MTAVDVVKSGNDILVVDHHSEQKANRSIAPLNRSVDSDFPGKRSNNQMPKSLQRQSRIDLD